jgi:hypothetical protein
MPAKSVFPVIPLPRTWPSHFRSAILHAIALKEQLVIVVFQFFRDFANMTVATGIAAEPLLTS